MLSLAQPNPTAHDGVHTEVARREAAFSLAYLVRQKKGKWEG